MIFLAELIKLNEARRVATAEQQDELVDLLKKTTGFSAVRVDDHNQGDDVDFRYQSDKFTATLKSNGVWDVVIHAGGSHLPVAFKLKTPASVVASVKQWVKENDTDE